MSEVDHGAQLPQEAALEPAKPITADLLLGIEEKQRVRFGGGKVKTGCVVLDEVLGGETRGRGDADGDGKGNGGGGLERGIVVGVSAEGREGEGVLISLNLIATMLMPYLTSSSTPKTTQPIAQIIDTTGSFPLALFANVVRSRLLSSIVPSHQTGPETANYTVVAENDNSRTAWQEGDIEELVGQALEIVAVSRVFDIEGLWEVLGEMNRPPAQTSPPAAQQQDKRETVRTSRPDWELPIEREIDDSQAETTPALSPPMEKQANEPELTTSHEEGIQILLIHTLTPLLTSTLSTRPKPEAHALITALSNTIHTLTTTHNILTILHNTAVPTSPSSKFHHESGGGSERKARRETHLAPSVFPSGTVKPALGLIFDQFVCLNILISPLPKSRGDAAVLYGHDSNNPLSSTVDPNHCLVIEILKDESPTSSSRLGAREASWTAVDVDGAGTGFVAAFEESACPRGEALGREREARGGSGARDQGEGRGRGRG
ncbi:hypothetical protein BJ875DRAFT_389838 [Amylocarpus encephaloides]|uniref:Uncharacterized protein n=1 Tax=Amylocarpus encephaloides TaxID=45428 RepID=A0A9P7Y7T2_9HELO|nr:hypothetical protein BJ875DRAFT_389838 [Amylocarpus encephaloides]